MASGARVVIAGPWTAVRRGDMCGPAAWVGVATAPKAQTERPAATADVRKRRENDLSFTDNPFLIKNGSGQYALDPLTSSCFESYREPGDFHLPYR